MADHRSAICVLSPEHLLCRKEFIQRRIKTSLLLLNKE